MPGINVGATVMQSCERANTRKYISGQAEWQIKLNNINAAYKLLSLCHIIMQMQPSLCFQLEKFHR